MSVSSLTAPVRSVAPQPAGSAGPGAAPRILGGVGAAAGVLFTALILWEHGAGLGSEGVAATVHRSLVAVAMAGFVALAAGIASARPGGDGRGAAAFPALLGGAWTVLLGATVLEQFHGAGTDVLVRVGGIAQAVALAGLGIATALAGRWSGWRRFYPLVLAVYVVGALVIPAFAGVEPSAVAEALGALGYAGLGMALLTEESPATQRIHGAVLATAAVVVAAGASAFAVTVAPASSPVHVSVVDQHGVVPSQGIRGPISSWDQTQGIPGPLSTRDQTLGTPGPASAPTQAPYGKGER